MTPAFEDHFSGVADGYARFRPSYPDALFDHLAAVSPGRRLAWDCGAGSGQASRALACRFEAVVASDTSESQLGRAPRLPNLCYAVAAAEAAPLPDCSADLVTVAQALHWFPTAEFFAEARRVLRPGGLFAAWCYVLMSVGPGIDEILRRFHRDIVGPYWPMRRRLVEEAYRTIDIPFTGSFPEFRMNAAWTLEELLGYLGTWSSVRNYRSERGAEPLDLIRDELAEAWGDPRLARTVRWPLHVRGGVRD